MELEEGDVILCTVDRIGGTIVFVNIDGTDLEGSIIFSEIAPGRIRNIRAYVVPKKKIVCKVLRVKDNQLHLSLRRVTQKEQKEVLEKHKQEKSYENILKTILKEKAKEIIQNIKKQDTLFDFFEEAKENPKEIEKLLKKEDAKKILEILKTQKKKIVPIKKIFNLTTNSPEGIEEIKKILNSIKDAQIKYISAGKYSIKVEDENAKKADQKLREILEKIENSAKKEKMEFRVKEK